MLTGIKRFRESTNIQADAHLAAEAASRFEETVGIRTATSEKQLSRSRLRKCRDRKMLRRGKWLPCQLIVEIR